jgi:repressor of nif and glnA expression
MVRSNLKVDSRGFLEQILQAGRELADKGLNAAEDKIGIPEAGS